MIRHICMFQLKDKADLPRVLDRAKALQDIPQIRRFLVTANAPGAPVKNYDFALIFDFASIEELNLYRDSEIHLAWRAFITPLRELRACIDYEL